MKHRNFRFDAETSHSSPISEIDELWRKLRRFCITCFIVGGILVLTLIEQHTTIEVLREQLETAKLELKASRRDYLIERLKRE